MFRWLVSFFLGVLLTSFLKETAVIFDFEVSLKPCLVFFELRHIVEALLLSARN